jgi:glycosyltransferase involved in cell wall biosynthesis
MLVLVGDGPDRNAAEDEARALGVSQSVRSLGKIDDVAPLLAAADLYLLPSESESFGLSALEALASGVPVIATNVGGLPEVVANGVTGALHPLGDVDAMAASALEFLEPKRWERASAAASADARKRFATIDVVGRYEALYAEALAAR